MPTQQPNHTSYINAWYEHIRYLAEQIGPRGPTTEGERQGAIYCQQVFERLGLSARQEIFTSARSIFQPHLLTSLAMLVAFIIYPLAGRVSAGLATLIALLALVSELMELSFKDNLLRKLVSKGPSQNVVAIYPPAQEHRQDLILIGHLDSQRTPLIFTTPRWLKAYENFTTVAFIAFAAEVLLYLLGTMVQWSWIWPVTGLCAVCAVLLAALCIQADRTPFTAGANDNASAVGLVLALAEHMQIEPLQNTRLWFVCTGCEEAQHYGAIDFFNRHQKEFFEPIAIAFEMLGCSGPAWLTKEGIVIPFHATPSLVALAEETAQQHKELNAYPAQINGGNTEMADALRLGIPAITLTGMTPDGVAPYWHKVSDTFDKTDLEALKRNYAFTWNFIQAIDRQAIVRQAIDRRSSN